VERRRALSRLAFAVVAVALGIALSAHQRSRQELTVLSVPRPMPALPTLEGWLNTGGAAPSIDALRGKVILLEYFAVW